MNNISSPHTGDPRNGHTSEEEALEHTNPYPHEINITEGGEYLDDAIRMKDQPVGEANPEE